MKKVFIGGAVLALIILSSCSGRESSIPETISSIIAVSEYQSESVEKTEKNVVVTNANETTSVNGTPIEEYFRQQFLRCIDQEDLPTAVKRDVVPDEEAAKAVATAIFKSCIKEKAYSRYVPQDVFFLEERGVWIVDFYEWEEPYTTVGGDFIIAIQKQDGKVVKMWIGE